MTKEQIREIAGNLELGLKCFIHKDSLEMIFIPDENKYPDIEEETWEKELKAIKNSKKRYFEIEGMDSGDSFRVMEEFIGFVDDQALREKLAQALGQPKPFGNFKFEIDNLESVRDKWFVFKEKKSIGWVEEQLRRIKV